LYATNAPKLNTNVHETIKEAYRLFEVNEFTKSQTLFEQAIPELENSQDVKDRLVYAIACNNLGELLRYMSKSGVNTAKGSKYTSRDITKLYRKAESILTQDQNAQDRTRKDEIAWWLGTFYNNNGLYLMENMNNFTEALERFGKSLEIRQELFMRTITDPDPNSEIDPVKLQCHIAITYNNIAQCHSNKQNPELALQQFNEALAVFARVRGHESVDVQYHKLYVITMNNIGLIHFNAGRYDEAIQQYTDALDVITGYDSDPTVKEVNKPNLVAVAAEEFGVTMSNLASAFFRSGRVREAEQFYRRALDVFEKVLQPNHKYIATTCTQLAMTLKQKHQSTSIEKDLEDNLLKSASSKLSDYRKKIYGRIFSKFQQDETPTDNEKEKDLKEAQELTERVQKVMATHIKNRTFK
jgi:tetratricopeptide (TPR) repeat protein